MFQMLRNSCTRTFANFNIIKKFPLLSSPATKFIKCETFSTSMEDNRDFMSFYPRILQDLTDAVKVYDETVLVHWMKKMLDHNLIGGKLHRGVTTVQAYKTLCQPSPNDLQLANYLGWCVEMLHSSFIILDDIIDKGEIRRGHLCWYKMPGVNLSAANDAVVIENAAYFILKKYFREKSYYVDVLELFHESTLIATIGQTLDMQMSQRDVQTFTKELYQQQTYGKTSHLLLNLPFLLAMRMADISDPELTDQFKPIFRQIGALKQINNDYSDCFGNEPEKNGTDIQDNKCSWLAITFLERATDQQKRIFIDNYGQRDVTKVNNVKQLYIEIGMEDIYKRYEEQSIQSILTEIEQLPTINLRRLMYRLMDRYSTALDIKVETNQI